MKPRPVVLMILVAVVSLGFSMALAQTFGVKKKRPKPDQFGNVVMNNFSKEKQVAPVVFPHWVHRSRYTCRLCHVDIGFAMKANETAITCEDNRTHLYCGSCHNGDEAFAPREATKKNGGQNNCDRCHSFGKDVELENDFYELARSLPRERFGNGIDWERSEREGLITLKDFLPGISIERSKLDNPEDLELKAREAGMPDIIFSHEKHAVWSGCELCHPDIFGVRTGETIYTMQEIFDGRWCGACHGSVAFPNYDCQRCHTKEVM